MVIIASLLVLTICADVFAQDRRDYGDVFEEDGRLYPGWLCEWCQTPTNYAAFAYNAYWGDNPWAWGSILGIPFRVYNLDGEWVVIWFEKFLIDMPSLLPNTMLVKIRLRSGEIVTIEVLQDGPDLMTGSTATSSTGGGGSLTSSYSLGLPVVSGSYGVVTIVDPDPDGNFPAVDEEE
jgi:hypothetical protein